MHPIRRFAIIIIAILLLSTTLALAEPSGPCLNGEQSERLVEELIKTLQAQRAMIERVRPEIPTSASEPAEKSSNDLFRNWPGMREKKK